MDSILNKEVSRVKVLKGNKGKSQEELKRQAFVNIKVRELRQNPLFSDSDEQKLAEIRFRSYLEANELESMSEIDILRSLIYNEVFEARIQKQLNKMADDNKAPYDKITKQLTDIQNQKLALKVKLGIDKDSKTESDLTRLQQLEKRFDRYILDHRNEFTWGYVYTCKKCNHKDIDLVLARKRVKDFSLLKHPWQAGRYLFNYEILKDVKSGKLSKHDAWRYLCCASTGGDYEGSFSEEYCTDYIDYCLEKWKEIVDHFTR